MTIQQWLNNKGDYSEGLKLYKTLDKHNKHLLRQLSKKETKPHYDKLVYELTKQLSSKIPCSVSLEIPNSRTSVLKKDPNIQKIETFKTVTPSKPTRINAGRVSIQAHRINKGSNKDQNKGFIRLNKVPSRLHEIAIEQRTLFQKAIAAKIQLNELHENEEFHALELCEFIVTSFDRISAIDKIIDHYLKHKTIILPKTEDFSELTPLKLLKAQSNKRSVISKTTKKIEVIKQNLKHSCTISQKKKLQVRLEKLQQRLLLAEFDLQQINKVIETKP